MNWSALSGIVSVGCIAFAIGVWANSSDSTAIKNTNEINELKSTIAKLKSMPLMTSQAQKTTMDLLRGAVVPFYRQPKEGCPPEWDEYPELAGRTIIGAGHGTDLSMRRLGDKGGSENHKLIPDEMPNHNHGGLWGGDKTKAGMNADFTHHTAGYTQITPQGKGIPHNNMQPYMVLLYCRKS